MNLLSIDGTTAKRPQVFVSYYHGEHRPYYERFSQLFHDQYELIRDGSLERLIDSADNEYVHRAIRERFITGTSCTVVLLGLGTAGRKFVDWEIKTTLDMGHGLVGVVLPAANVLMAGVPFGYPPRFADNVESRYAVVTSWDDIIANPLALVAAVAAAKMRSRALIANGRPMFERNRSLLEG